VKIRFGRFRQERAPEAALPTLPQDRVKVSANLVRIAVPAQTLKRDFQFGIPAAGKDLRCRGQAQIDTFEVLFGADDPDLKGLVVRRYLEFEIRKARRRQRHEQFHDVEPIGIFARPQNLLRIQRRRGNGKSRGEGIVGERGGCPDRIPQSRTRWRDQ
jgi:hypothetical protein